MIKFFKNVFSPRAKQNETDDLGDISTLADPSVIDSLLQK